MTNSFVRLALAVPALAASETLMSRPVAKVTALLQQMLTEKTAEQEEDNEIKSKLDCWSKKSEETSEAIVTEAKATHEAAMALLEESAAGKAGAEASLKSLKKKKEDYSTAVDAAHAEWDQRNEKFQSEHVGELADLKALEQAINQVAKSHPESLAQQKESVLFARRVVKSIMFRHGSSDLASSKAVTAFLSEDGDAEAEGDNTSVSGIDLDSLNGVGSSSYDSESGSILGILKQIYEDLEGDMGSEYKEHQEAEASYLQFVATKTDQLATIDADIITEQNRFADYSEKYITSKATIGESAEKLENSMAFLKELKEQSQLLDHEHTERQKMRGEEITALTSAIEMLTSDENRALFDKTTKKSEVSFLQLARTSLISRRDAAARVLAQVSSKTKSKTLSAVAAAIRASDSAGLKDKIFQLIDENVNELKQQKADDVATKDECIGTFQRIETDTHDANEEKKASEASIAFLEKQIEQADADIATLEEQNSELKISMLESSEDREQENEVFQRTTKDNRAAAGVLLQVKDELAKVYNKKAAFLQGKNQDVERPDGVEARPQGFSEYSQHSGAGGVLMLMDKIIADTQGLLKETMAAEIEAQATYEKFTLSSQDDIASNNAQIGNLREQKADLSTERQEKADDLQLTESQLKDLDSELSSTHAECDFLVQNFDLRQEKFDDEIDGLNTAKQTLQGANFS